jgi:hypothetical protein
MLVATTDAAHNAGSSLSHWQDNRLNACNQTMPMYLQGKFEAQIIA